MKNVVVTLLSQKPAVISEFLKLYYNQDVVLDEGAFKWSCFYERPSDTIGLIATLIDNDDKFKIETLVTLNKVATIKVTEENVEELIRLFLFTAK